ncbi:MAG: aldehyde dehydrogenase [Chitinophagaceae bacterium]|nr:MAG: aldehyde dehydrogenase [Chitinophagaceae bacterium]
MEMQPLRQFYDSGATRSFAFRTEQLKKLRDLVTANETAITHALYTDLHKSREEAYATEIGLFMAEINHAIKNLRKWMAPKRVKTTLANLPSTSRVYRDPLGVVLIAGPWNYPFQLVIVPLMAAMAAGNCAVIKPSEHAPATAAVLEQIITKNFPADYITVVTGDGEKILPALMDSFRFDHLFFTGSIAVGKILYQLAARQLIPVTLELGGKSPVVVEPDAAMPVAANRIVLGKFINAGQTCIAPDYILVHQSVKDQLVSSLIRSIENFYTTDPLTSHDFGRIINTVRFDKLLAMMQEGRIIYGGQHNRDELFIAPTLVELAGTDVSLMQEEIFGPVLPVITYNDKEEALNIINLNPNPLAFYVFTASNSSAAQWIRDLAFGGGCINNTAYHFTNLHLPFGGVGNSGIGLYHGRYSFDAFSRPKPVMKTPVWFDPRIRYPSFKGKINLLKKIFR